MNRLKLHVLKPGENLENIAERFEMTLDDLLDANDHLTRTHDLPIGTKVKIPNSKANRGNKVAVKMITRAAEDKEFKEEDSFNYGPFKWGDEVNQYSLDGRHEEFEGKSDPSYPYRPPVDTYIVQEGDTLWTLCKKLGLTVFELQLFNPHIKDLEKIQPGMKLYFPSSMVEPIPLKPFPAQPVSGHIDGYPQHPMYPEPPMPPSHYPLVGQHGYFSTPMNPPQGYMSYPYANGGPSQPFMMPMIGYPGVPYGVYGSERATASQDPTDAINSMSSGAQTTDKPAHSEERAVGLTRTGSTTQSDTKQSPARSTSVIEDETLEPPSPFKNSEQPKSKLRSTLRISPFERKIRALVKQRREESLANRPKSSVAKGIHPGVWVGQN
jgi:LysM repeat protein